MFDNVAFILNTSTSVDAIAVAVLTVELVSNALIPKKLLVTKVLIYLLFL